MLGATRFAIVASALVVSWSTAAPVRAQTGAHDEPAAPSADGPPDPAAPERTLVVGVKDSPPFLIKNDDGSWGGISVALWSRIAGRMNVGYRLVESDVTGLLDDVQSGAFDLAIAPLTITADREERVDFSQPFFVGGMGIAVKAGRHGGWTAALGHLVSIEFVGVVLSLLLVLLVSGLLMWLAERRRNPEQFGGGVAPGLGAGIWWSAVTMTTVGYGDKAPRTAAGRLVAIAWMFTSVIVISSFTAGISSALTVSRLEGAVRGPEDLPSVRVGTVAGTHPAETLSRMSIGFRAEPGVTDALDALVRGEIDAVVYDAAILRYLVRVGHADTVTVLAATFEPQHYGFALPPASPMRESLDRALLAEVSSARWRGVLRNYLGHD